MAFTDGDGSANLDLLDPDGIMLGRGFNLGVSVVNKTYLTQPPYDGAELAETHRGVVTMRLPLNILPLGGTVTELKHQLELLAAELEKKHNFLEFKPDNYTAEGIPGGNYIVETFRADVPSLFREIDVPSPFKLKTGGPQLMLDIDRMPRLSGAGQWI